VAVVVLREALPSDGHSIELVLSASFSRLLKDVYSDSLLSAALPSMTRANPALLCSGTYYVVEEADGHLVGCGGWTHQKPGESETVPGTGHIRHFAIHPDWNGRGIGRSIYNYCEGRAREAGVKMFECYSTLNAEPFYVALGFQTVSKIEVMMGGTIPFPAVLLRRSI
jgi:predicted N-acetyltransferase YhbS